MILHDQTIPAEFKRPDDRTTTADQYINAHDEQMYRENHNILVAQRQRHTICTQLTHDDTNSRDPVLIRSLTPVSVNRDSGFIAWFAPLFVSRFTKSIIINVRASRIGANTPLYPVVDGPRNRQQLNTSLAMTPVDATETKYTSTAPVPYEACLAGFGQVYIYAETPMYGADLKGGPVAITGVGVDGDGGSWITIGVDGTFIVGTAVYFSDSEIPPRVITERATDGVTDRLRFREPWGGKYPIVGSTTCNVRQVAQARIHGVSIYEERVSDFSDERDDT